MNNKIKLAISKGKIKGATKLLQEHFESIDKSTWVKEKQLSYDALYKTVTVPNVTDEDGIVIEESYTTYQEDILTFQEWLDETKTVIVGTETATDDNGLEYQKEIFEEQIIRPYIASDVSTLVNDYIKVATLPSVVSMRQARIALHRSGLLVNIESTIENGNDEEMKIEWKYSTDIRRDWSSLISLTESMGMTSNQLDDLFILADSL